MTMNNGVARLEWACSVAPVISRLPLLPGRTVAHAYSVLFLNVEKRYARRYTQRKRSFRGRTFSMLRLRMTTNQTGIFVVTCALL